MSIGNSHPLFLSVPSRQPCATTDQWRRTRTLVDSACQLWLLAAVCRSVSSAPRRVSPLATLGPHPLRPWSRMGLADRRSASWLRPCYVLVPTRSSPLVCGASWGGSVTRRQARTSSRCKVAAASEHLGPASFCLPAWWWFPFQEVQHTAGRGFPLFMHVNSKNHGCSFTPTSLLKKASCSDVRVGCLGNVAWSGVVCGGTKGGDAFDLTGTC